jgi:hypothetical protein
MKRYGSVVSENIVNVAGYLDYPETFPSSLSLLRELKSEIDTQLKLHNVVKVK